MFRPGSHYKIFLCNWNLHSFLDKKLVLAGDFNAKNAVWGGTLTDERGEMLFKFLLSHIALHS